MPLRSIRFGKNLLFAVLISSTLIPFQLILVPLFIGMSRIGSVNSPYSMVIPWVTPAFGIFLMRQFALSIPTELLEAARLDGASSFVVIGRLFYPFCVRVSPR